MIKKLFLITLLSFSVNQMFADATDDLFTAIEQGDIAGAETALANGAQIMRQRKVDAHTAFSFALAKHNEALQSLRSYKGIVPAIASLGLPAAAILHNPKWGIASTVASLSTNIIDENSAPSTVALAGGLSLAGTIGIAINAWKSKYKIFAFIGLAGILVSGYHQIQVAKRSHIVRLILEAAQATQ